MFKCLGRLFDCTGSAALTLITQRRHPVLRPTPKEFTPPKEQYSTCDKNASPYHSFFPLTTVEARSRALFEKACMASQACPASKTKSATSKGTRQVICEFTTLLAGGVAQEAASSIAEAFLELLDVLLVGGGNFRDLVFDGVGPGIGRKGQHSSLK